MSEILFYTYPTSPYGMKVGCYLKYKQLDYRFIPVNPVTNRQIRFTRQRQVPVLEINGEWRKESSELGIWLDELYPERPLLRQNEEENQRILEIDRWISDSLIPSAFRLAYEWESTLGGLRRGWRLAKIVNDATPIPVPLRILWPFLIRRAGFIVRMMDMIDLSEPIPDMQQRLAGEFVAHLGGGPFLGGQREPSLADLSAFPIIVSGEMLGLGGPSIPLDDPALIQWVRDVQRHLPENPMLAPDRLLKKKNLFAQ